MAKLTKHSLFIFQLFTVSAGIFIGEVFAFVFHAPGPKWFASTALAGAFVGWLLGFALRRMAQREGAFGDFVAFLNLPR